MAASQQLETVAQKWKTFGERAQSLGTIQGFRIAYEELAAEFPTAEDITCERVGMGGVPGEWISAPDAQTDRVILYLHGGGYIIGSTRTHREMVSRTHIPGGHIVLSVNL